MRFIQFEPVYIRHFTTLKWPFPLHNHNHYELMYIHKGKGIHLLNGVSRAYKGKAVFFLSPDDTHDFIIQQETQFSVIKFLPAALKTGAAVDDWDMLLESLIRKRQENYAQWAASLDLDRIQQLVNLITGEWQANRKKITELHVHLIRSVLIVMKNNVKKIKTVDDYGAHTVERIQNFIHQNIFFPEKLKVAYLAKTFGLSGSHLRAVFKKQVEQSLTSYMQSLKFQMIKDRLGSSGKTLTEISREFGFSDSSHFNKFFRRMAGIGPKQFCKRP
jgi:AraC-like DNA-binding protein